MDITIQNASVQDMDRLMKMIDGMSDESPAMPSDDGAPMGGGCSVCGGDDHEEHDHPHDDASPEPSPCGGDDEHQDNAQIMRKHMGMLANAANEVEERLGNAPANTNDGAPDVKGDTHTDYSIRGAIKNHHASTISGDNPLEDIHESEMFERYTSFTGRDFQKKKDELDEAPPVGPAGAPPKPANMKQAQQDAKAPAKTQAQQVGYGAGQVDPRLAQAAGVKQAPAAAPATQVGYKAGQVDPRLAQAAAGAKPAAQAAPATQVGYKAGQVDPRLAQAAGGAKPAPAQAVATGPAGGDRSGPAGASGPPGRDYPSTPAPAVATGPAGGDRSGPTAQASPSTPSSVAQAGPAGGDRSGPTAQASPSTPAPTAPELAKIDAELEKQAQVQQKQTQKLSPAISKITKPLTQELPGLAKSAKAMGNQEVSGTVDQLLALNKKLGSLIPGVS